MRAQKIGISPQGDLTGRFTIALFGLSAAAVLTGCPDERYQELGDRDRRFHQGETR